MSLYSDPVWMQERQEAFLLAYEQAMSAALDIVQANGKLGRNDFRALPDMFAHGRKTVADLLYMKIARLIGTEELDEALDIINYAAFYVALIYLETGEPPPVPEIDPEELIVAGITESGDLKALKTQVFDKGDLINVSDTDPADPESDDGGGTSGPSSS